ncbi:MAG: thioredoxin domain-containing protein, partial [Caldilineaceae bacterium]|nr:thioredoxin domain-containing protein [Caldilineaceae bacterium]
EGEEGKFFVWTPAEIEAVLDVNEAKLLQAHYGVSARGNFEGHNILHVRRPLEDVAQELGLTLEQAEAQLAAAKAKLFAAREQRIKPARDEKILVEWNGLMIHALAEVGVVMGRQDALDAAIAAADFILNKMSQPDGKLYRSYKDGRARLNAYLEDYAAFARALVALYEATFDLRWLGEASRLTKIIFEQFHDSEKGGFFQTGIDHEILVARRKDYIDNAVPSGNSLVTELLLRLAVLVENEQYRREATRVLLTLKEAMAQQPTGFGRMLTALHTVLHPSQEIALVGDPADGATRALLAEVRQRYLPTTVLALKQPDEEAMLPLLAERSLVNGQPAAYVCENYACQLPVTTVAKLAELLER